MTQDLCPGRRSTALQGLYGVCIRCDRQHAAGGMEPAVAQESGVAQCINWVPLKMAARNRMSERVAG